MKKKMIWDSDLHDSSQLTTALHSKANSELSVSVAVVQRVNTGETA